MSIRPLIEQWFPAEAVGAESLRELASVRTMPKMRMLHVWWARRPLTASRAAILGSMLPAWPSTAESANANLSSSISAVPTATTVSELTCSSRWCVSVVGLG